MKTLGEIVQSYNNGKGDVDWKRVKTKYGTDGAANNKLYRRSVDAMKKRLKKKLGDIGRNCGPLNEFALAIKPAALLTPEQMAYFEKERCQPSNQA
jgi:hypothetical protein